MITYNESYVKTIEHELEMNSSTRRSRQRKKKAEFRKKLMKVGILLLIVLALLFGWHEFRHVTQSIITPVRGVDVSSYQKSIDWEGISQEGYYFAYIKATEGSNHIDPEFQDNWEKARKAGLTVGAYHFLSFDSKGEKQADNFIEQVDKSRRSLPPAVDLEMYGDYEQNPPSQEKVDAVLQPLLEKLEKKYDKEPIIYTTPYLYEQYISGKYENVRIWVSDPDMADQLPDGKDWTFCQYSSEGSSSNVEGTDSLDLNYYQGNLWELKHLK